MVLGSLVLSVMTLFYAHSDLEAEQNGLLAFQGFDVVSLAEKSRFQKGFAEFRSEFHGLIYYFESQASLEIFNSAPKKYDYDALKKSVQSRNYYFVDDQGVALAGYDVVAYFETGVAAVGKRRWQASFDGIRYWFSSKQHLELFQRDPERFLPQFGGWCAYGLSFPDSGYGFPAGKYAPNPEQFLIKDGKLYLFQKNAWIQARYAWLSEGNACFLRAKKYWKRHQ